MDEYIEKLKTLGYNLDGSLADWELLMNNTEIFGKDWKRLARANYDCNVDFMLFIKTYIPE
jgi:hypothetical protein